MSKRVAVVLAGSGYLDGAEIQEAVLTLYNLELNKADVQCFAPDKEQMHVVDHLKVEPVEGEIRNVLTESARITRGKIKPLTELAVDNFDAIIFPGGFGAAKNLCDFAVKGADCSVDPDVEKVIKDFHDAEKPIGMMCISPVIVARVLGRGVEVTIGNDDGAASAINSFGANHIDSAVVNIVVDDTNKIVTAPAYMYDESIVNVGKGITKLVCKVLDMV
jgi:enhancing lycopene biosynthesis protein 2